ncbi:hypothetical protein P4C99_10590 [Pontiellaceae bacterium B1224]|nr:hypothetical protein [Pontiellaceae bacterium B1224]
MSISVDQRTGHKAREIFQALERQVYADDPFYIPSPLSLPDDGGCFIAHINKIPAACCCARLQTGNPALGTIGHFQALENPVAVKALLNAAVQWLEQLGAERIVAPMEGDTWHSYRFNTGPFDEPPFIKEPWNPPYYPAMIESAGFTVTETYDSHIVSDPATAAANQKKFYDRCLKQGYTFSPITAKNFNELLPEIYSLSCRIFAGNVLYTPISQEEFKCMYLPAKTLMQKGLSWIAHDADQKPVGYVFTFPDYADALRAMKGKNNLTARIRFLLKKGSATRTCLKTLGTLPEKRGSGLTAALTYLSYKNSVDLGYRQTLMCLMHSSNDSRRFGGKVNRPFRSYALYEYIP